METIYFCPTCKRNVLYGHECRQADASPSEAPGSATYVDKIVCPLEDYAQSVFTKDKPRYDRILETCQRLRQLIKE